MHNSLSQLIERSVWPLFAFFIVMGVAEIVTGFALTGTLVAILTVVVHFVTSHAGLELIALTYICAVA